MNAYHVGIDFGTSQTKVCVKDLLKNTYFFHKFKVSSNYFMPSTIQVDRSGFCSFGIEGSDQIRFFKMAALHDEQFDRIISENLISSNIDYTPELSGINSIPSNQDELAKFPELCCIIYLAQIISELQESLQHVEKTMTSVEVSTDELGSEEKDLHQEKHTNSFGRILSLLKKKSQNQHKPEQVTVKRELVTKKELRVTKPTLLLTIGIPTEYDSNYNILRRQKMYQMLLMANKLSKTIGTADKFGKTCVSELIQHLRDIFEDTINGKHLSGLEELYNKEGLFVIAETTAGIEPIRNDRKRMLFEIINRSGNDWQDEYYKFKQNHAGCYMTMDIGAGTTDISFFQMITFSSGEIKIKYYSSQPIPYASNQIISNYLKSTNFEVISKFDFTKTSSEEWQQSQIGSRQELYRIINGYRSASPEASVFGRVRSIFRRHKLSLHRHWHYEDPPPHVLAKGCLVYGGGSRFNEFGTGDLPLEQVTWNQGTYTRIKKLIQGNEIIYNLSLSQKNGYPVERHELQEIIMSLDMLIVSLGLAMLSPGNRGDTWLDIDEYLPDSTPVHIDPNKPIFDLFKRKWI